MTRISTLVLLPLLCSLPAIAADPHFRQGPYEGVLTQESARPKTRSWLRGAVRLTRRWSRTGLAYKDLRTGPMPDGQGGDQTTATRTLALGPIAVTVGHTATTGGYGMVSGLPYPRSPGGLTLLHFLHHPFSLDGGGVTEIDHRLFLKIGTGYPAPSQRR